MGSTLVSLFPLIIGSAVVPVQIIIGILLLKSPDQGLLKASAYAGGITTVRLLQGLIFGLILTGASATTEVSSGPGPVVSTFLLLLGILLLITAYKQWTTEGDPDGPPPRWLTMPDKLTVAKSFGLGSVLMLIGAKFWVFTLSAIATISEAQLGQPSSTITFLLFVLLAESLLLIPILLRVIIPNQSKSLLDGISAWLNKNNRPIVIAVALVFGLLFLYQGASGLLS